MVKNMPKFSIVMPVYNTSEFLNAAIQSVLQQEFGDWELILVNDCSTDSSPQLCNEAARTDERIRVIHLEKNQGLSAVRNIGMEHASGEYLCFIDSDDTIEKGLLTAVHQSTEESAPQAVMFGCIEDYYNKEGQLKKSYPVMYPSRILTSRDAVRREILLVEKSTLFGYAWNKFYSSDSLKEKGVRFKQITLIEDFLFNLEFFENVSRFHIVDYPGYHYNKRVNQSLTGKFVKDYFELHAQRVSSLLEQYQKWRLCDDTVKKTLGNIYVRYIFSTLQRNCDKRSQLTHQGRKAWVEELYHQPLFQQLIPYAHPEQPLARMMSRALKCKRTHLLLCLGRLIYVIKGNLPVLFARLKQGR